MKIREYQLTDQQEVLDLILPIQQQEFGIAITKEDQPDLCQVNSVYQTGKGNFWVAEDNGLVVGTIALIDIGAGLAGNLPRNYLEIFSGASFL